jgi:Protein of unknown function (DUF3572)
MQRQGGISRVSREEAQGVAIGALGFLAAEPERLGRFLAITGLGPENLRAAASEPGFLGQVLDHLAQDESLLMAFAAHNGESPARIAAAHQALTDPRHERDDA